MDHLVIISGGPGGGKTTLVDALAVLGHGHTVEAGRYIIRAQAEIGGMGVHFGDQALFAELMLMHEIRSYEDAAAAPGLVFCDRGIPELYGYLSLVGRPVPAHFRRASEVYRYNPTVFLTPPWQEIFGADAERRQDWDEAVRTYVQCEAAYRAAGYRPVVLPKASVAERVKFVLSRVGQARDELIHRPAPG